MKEVYEQLLKSAESLVDGEPDLIANASNISALVYERLNDQEANYTNWVGFYFMKPSLRKPDVQELVLGPFQGKVACIRIKIGKGVCGTAVAEKKLQVIKDVHDFPGHIACDSASQSEVVVPLLDKDGNVFGVFDIDSPTVGRFTDIDGEYLSKIGALLLKHSSY
eukprot:Nk52_evm13s162 gene=Nk52_evmTU13s162